MFAHSGYQLHIHSDIQLWTEQPIDSPTVRIRIDPHLYVDATVRHLRLNSQVAAGSFRGIALYRITHSQILLKPTSRLDVVARATAGPLLGTLLHQRGVAMLHGSAASKGGGVSVFLGPHGAGKSTLCALLGARGYSFISDGATAVSFSDGLRALPGPPIRKLNADSLEALAVGRRDFRRAGDKYIVPVEAPQTNSIPIRRLFVLSRGKGFFVKRLRPAEALGAIFANMYLAPYVSVQDTKQLFRLAGMIARCVETSCLQVDDTFQSIDALFEFMGGVDD